MDLPGPLLVVPPSRRPHTHTVIFLHGRGDTAHALAEGLHHFTDARSRSLFEMFSSFRWVFPQAPLRKAACTGGNTYQWFDVWDMRESEEWDEVQRGGLADSVGRMGRLVRDEVGLLGGRWEGVVVAGISQGGATAVHTLLGMGERIGAVIGFSCRLPFARATATETGVEVGLEDAAGVTDAVELLRDLPVLLEHCADDPLVPVEAGRELRDRLAEWGAQVTWREYPNGGHWFNMDYGAEDVARFLRSVFQLSRDGITLGGG